MLSPSPKGMGKKKERLAFPANSIGTKNPDGNCDIEYMQQKCHLRKQPHARET